MGKRTRLCKRGSVFAAGQGSGASRITSRLSAEPLLAALASRGIVPATAALDKGYDAGFVYDACESRGIAPIIPVKQTEFVKRGDHLAPTCKHSTWTFAGADFKRKATKWRCPTGDCEPKSLWRKASRLHPLIPRETKRWAVALQGPRLGRAGVRAAQERVRTCALARPRLGACPASR
jgi:hypothetical protein